MVYLDHAASTPMLPEAVAAMESRAAAIAAGEAPELVWLLEHPPVYTLGQAGRIDGVTPASLTLILAHTRRSARSGMSSPA